jgi:hypothetical protein
VGWGWVSSPFRHRAALLGRAPGLSRRSIPRPISYGIPGVLLNGPSSLQNHFHQATEEQHHKIKHELMLFFVRPAFTAGLRAHCSVVSNARSRQ